MENTMSAKELKQIRMVVMVVLVLTILTQLIDNAFTLITPILGEKFNISTDVASWVASIGGIGIAIGFFAFSSFTDFISEKKLLIIGVLLFCLPSITGLLFQSSYTMVVISRFIQAVGGISTSALYLVLVARYIDGKEQVIWMGLCTASFTISTVIGTLTGGFLSTFFGWQVIFYIPFLGLLALPIIIKYMPEQPKKRSNIDYLGFLILTAFVVSINFLVANPSLILLVSTIVFVILFLFYISKAKNPLISMDFFKNKSYMMMLASTFFYYLSQVALVFITPFLLEAMFGYSLNKTALIFIVPYTISGVIAIFSGSIINRIGMKTALTTGALLIMAGFVYGGFQAYISTTYVLIALTLITGGYALSFGPLLTKAISFLPETEIGTGIGFFNFTVRTANALGISIVAFLLNSNLDKLNLISLSNKAMIPFTYIFIILALTTLVGIVMYHLVSEKKSNNLEEN